MAIAEESGIRRAPVSRWIRARREAGTKALTEAPRGRPVGTGRRLTAEQEARLQQAIVDQTPDPLKLRFALWSSRAVRALIRRWFAVDMPVRPVRKYLNRWEYTPQRPLKRACERDDKAVRHWLEDDYPAIAARAKAEGAEIQRGDVTAVSSIEHHPRGQAPRGKTPARVLSQSRRHRINVISAISSPGSVRFMMYRDTLTATTLTRFLQRLIREAGRKVFPVPDDLRGHHSRKVRGWLEGV